MARAAKRSRRLWDTYSFPGFRPEPTVRGIFGDPKARVITLKRRSKKNGMRVLRSRADGLVRPQGPPGTRSVLRRHADISGIGGAAPRLSRLWQGEAGAARLSGGQSTLHQALCLLCGPPLPAGADQGGGGGT